MILAAAVEELAEVGYGQVRMESVAARAGVAKSTLYRHWPDKLALIADAFETFHEQMVPDLGDLPTRDAVALLIRHVAEIVVDSTSLAASPPCSREPNATPEYASFITAIPPSAAKR